MLTLKDIKRRVRFLLDQYSENGDIISVSDTFYADSDLKFNDAVDYIQRKISVTSKKLIGRASLVLKNPGALAMQKSHDEFVITEGKEAFIKVPASAKTFSFTLGTEIGANIKIEAYAFKKNTANLSPYEFGTPYDLKTSNADLTSAVEHKERNISIQAVQQITRAAGYLPAYSPESDVPAAFILKIKADANYPAVISGFAAYGSFFSSKELIPESGYTTASLPSDIIELLTVEKCIDGSSEPQPLKPAETKNLIFSKETKILTAPVENSGVYRITYYKYPKRIAYDSPDDTEVELDEFSVDALIFGVASLICPIENAAIIARMNSLFEEMMRNLYNSDKSVKRIENKMFGSRRLKLGAK